MIWPEHKTIFIHIPKTGGTSVEHAIGIDYADCVWMDKHKMWKQHATIQQIKAHLVSDIHNHYKFTFVRNPWDRAVSDWMYLTQQKCHTFQSCRVKLQSPTLKDYLLSTGGYEKYNHLNSSSGRGDHWFTQHSYIAIDGVDQMDYIGRFENLQQDFDTICDRIGIQRRLLPGKNKTKHKNYTEYYDDETRDIVAKRYAKDIEYFGYKFGM